MSCLLPHRRHCSFVSFLPPRRLSIRGVLPATLVRLLVIPIVMLLLVILESTPVSMSGHHHYCSTPSSISVSFLTRRAVSPSVCFQPAVASNSSSQNGAGEKRPPQSVRTVPQACLFRGARPSHLHRLQASCLLRERVPEGVLESKPQETIRIVQGDYQNDDQR